MAEEKSDAKVLDQVSYFLGVGDKRKRATGRILRLSLTNPLNSQLDTNVILTCGVKKWKYHRT